MKAVVQYQPNWMEKNEEKPRYVIWLEPEDVLDRRVLNKLVQNCDKAGWTGLHEEMVIIALPDPKF